MNRPLLLLIGTGAALGLNFPIGKLAMSHGVNPALWAAVISLGAGLAMFLAANLTEVKRPNAKSTLQFAIISGLISYLVFSILQRKSFIPHRPRYCRRSLN